jgi:pSer/pThr/pTyr-binding forkhead associated (FHA) protein
MSVADEDATIAAHVQPARALTITLGAATYTAEPSDAPITIGREFPAEIPVADHRISRTHLRLQIEGGQWTAQGRVDGMERMRLIRDDIATRVIDLAKRLTDPEDPPHRKIQLYR